MCVCVCVCVSFFSENAPQHRNPRSEGIFNPAATPQNPAATPQRAVLAPRLAHTRELCFLKMPRNPAAPGQRAFLTPQQPRRTPQSPATLQRGLRTGVARPEPPPRAYARAMFSENAPQSRSPRSEGIFNPAATPQSPAEPRRPSVGLGASRSAGIAIGRPVAVRRRHTLRSPKNPRLAHTRELCFLKMPRNPAAPGQRAFLTPQQPRRTPQNPAAALRCQRLLTYLAHSRHIWLQAQTANRPIRCRIGGCGDHHQGVSRATPDRDRPQSP